MPETIVEKKQRILGNAADDSPVVLEAIRSGEWTARDAVDYWKAMHPEKSGSYAERVAETLRRSPRTPN